MFCKTKGSTPYETEHKFGAYIPILIVMAAWPARIVLMWWIVPTGEIFVLYSKIYIPMSIYAHAIRISPMVTLEPCTDGVWKLDFPNTTSKHRYIATMTMILFVVPAI